MIVTPSDQIVKGYKPHRETHSAITIILEFEDVFFSLVNLRCRIMVVYHTPPSSRLVQTTPVHIMPDVIHPPHSWSSFCLLLNLFTLFPLSMLSIHVSCLAFYAMFSIPESPNFIAPLSVSLSQSCPLVSHPQHSTLAMCVT